MKCTTRTPGRIVYRDDVLVVAIPLAYPDDWPFPTSRKPIRYGTTGSALAAQEHDHRNDDEDCDASEPESGGNRVALIRIHGSQ